LQENEIEAVIHFAAFSLVGESGKVPLDYYTNNVCGSLSLLIAMLQAGVDKLVFSSTAAVYGEPEKVPIEEADAKLPVNVYGRTKLAVEGMLADFEQAYGLRSIALRYFNAAGALPDGSMGEAHSPETHLIPILCQAALGQREAVTIFGDDYNTPDGTCIRDYVHVCDLAQAHILALESLQNGADGARYNVGYGHGFSVKEMVDAAKKASGVDFKVELGARRDGDPATLIADATAIKKGLGWQPQYDDLDAIMAHAWAWHAAHPNGYEDE
jgi:UDP-glucose 4-epimerase